jgi:hypothetical protein
VVPFTSRIHIYIYIVSGQGFALSNGVQDEL